MTYVAAILGTWAATSIAFAGLLARLAQRLQPTPPRWDVPDDVAGLYAEMERTR